MTTDVLTSFLLDKDFDLSRIILIKEINRCDSSFITSCVLGHCIKNKKAIFVMSTHNSLQHYHNVGLKMNYNLQKSIESGLVNFYDAGQDLVHSLLENKPMSVDDFWLNIKDKLLDLQKKFGTVNVIFDGVSHLFDLGFSVRQVNEICKNIINLVRSSNNSYLILHCNVANDEDSTNVLANLLAHKSQIVAEVENLSSGLSADVSGHLIIKHLYQKFENEHSFTIEPKVSQYLFKLFDRGVKLLAPGTV